MHASPRAKINLTLAVEPRGADGYHPIESLILRVGLADELVVAFADRGPDTLTVAGLPGCPVEGNLVLRAFALMRQAIGHDLPPLVAHLDKRIPMAAGLGGGSADGAAALEAAEVMWGVGISPQTRAAIELELGADVPFFARGGDAALVAGRGEQVGRLPAPTREPGILLVTPPFGLNTAHVFARFDELAPHPQRRLVPGLDEALREPALLRDANDLWPAAASIEPRLAGIRDELERLTKVPWLMSGSGSTMFALYPSAEEATAAGRLLVSAESESLSGAIINAVDLTGPDPLWRYS
ncbi:MAG: 4-diphosphocytidyl-2-C-methyl-D-erythritol kinase [Chloroflexota bacterium]|jgi:4-diphosphocytidyl-2-C-methyl-D-erythritol kinase|nr:4-diphosphocytidyl-2-C-methyl-D-erythritol kinase [Chloroflexota bacterium]